MGWYYISCVLFGRKVKPQSRLFWLKKYETKTNLSIPRLEALTLTTYSSNIYNIFTSLQLLYIQLQTTSNTRFKLKFLMQLTKQLL